MFQFLVNKKTATMMIIAVFLIVVDRLFKVLALNVFNSQPIEIFNGFKLGFAINKNVAFSLPAYGVILNLVIIVLIIALVWQFLKLLKIKQTVQASLIFMVILGAVSNLLDRFLYGGVIDYFDVERFTIFNIADAMITIGIIVFVRISLKQYVQNHSA